MSGLHDILEVIEERKEQMSDECYRQLVDNLQRIHTETNGNYTTDYRTMYISSQENLNQTLLSLQRQQENNALFQPGEYIYAGGGLTTYYPTCVRGTGEFMRFAIGEEDGIRTNRVREKSLYVNGKLHGLRVLNGEKATVTQNFKNGKLSDGGVRRVGRLWEAVTVGIRLKLRDTPSSPSPYLTPSELEFYSKLPIRDIVTTLPPEIDTCNLSIYYSITKNLVTIEFDADNDNSVAHHSYLGSDIFRVTFDHNIDVDDYPMGLPPVELHHHTEPAHVQYRGRPTKLVKSEYWYHGVKRIPPNRTKINIKRKNTTGQD